MGTPSGQGVFAGGAYWLPLQGETKGKAACVAQLDVVGGEVKARAALPDNQVPGNLVVVDGLLLSQTPLGVAGFGPQEGKKDSE